MFHKHETGVFNFPRGARSSTSLLAGRTSIVIAHRLSTVRRMDELIILDRGRIAERGAHDALLHRDGIYAALWRHQSGGFLVDEGAAASSRIVT